MTMSVSAGAGTSPETDPTSEFIAAALDAIPESPNEPRTISNARLFANRANAKLSSGPRTSEGKEKSSKNALKTGLTGLTVLLPTDDVIVYQALVNSIFDQYAPATDEENRLVQLLADTEWRIHRIAPLEAGIFAVARLELPDLFLDETDPQRRDGLCNAKIQILYEKQLKNLAFQERRLRNQHKADTEKLQQLQQARIDKQKKAQQAVLDEKKAIFDRAVTISTNCHTHRCDFDPARFGFDFSLEEFFHYWKLQNAQYKLTLEYLDFHQVIADFRSAKKESPAA